MKNLTKMKSINFDNKSYKLIFIGKNISEQDVTTCVYQLYINDDYTDYFVKISELKRDNKNLFISFWYSDDLIPYDSFYTVKTEIDLELMIQIIQKTVLTKYKY